MFAFDNETDSYYILRFYLVHYVQTSIRTQYFIVDYKL